MSMDIRLSPESVTRLRELSQQTQELRAAIAKAKRTGLDVTQAEQLLNQAETLRSNLLRDWGPVGASRR